jgi:hypothetical protein
MAIGNAIGIAPIPVILDSPQTTAFGEASVSINNGRIFGQFQYNLNAELFVDSSTASGQVTVSPPFSLTASGAATNSSGVLVSRRSMEYFPGCGGLVRFTAVFDTSVSGNNQLVGLGDSNNGFFIGYNGTTFSICRRSGGSNNFVAQADFNIDTLDGTGDSVMLINPQMGNVYQIQYQWLGFGQISFFVENPESGLFRLFHVISYANANTTTSIQNPSLPLRVESINTSNNTDVVIKVPSIAAYMQGNLSEASFLVHGANSIKTISTETAIITIRNNSVFAGLTNYVQVGPQIITAASDGSKSVLFNIRKNTALGGSPSFVDYNSNTSVISIDTAGTTVTGGIFIGSLHIAKVSNDVLDMSILDILLSPGETLTISALSAASNDVNVSIIWKERFS